MVEREVWSHEAKDGGVDGLLRAGLAHVWFESIHPFDDGNGRIGRAIVDLALAQDARRSTHYNLAIPGWQWRRGDVLTRRPRKDEGMV